MPKKNDLCYCCSQIEFKICCEPFLKGKQIPNTPELLMRSRYTAFCLTDMVYVQKTMQGKALQNFNLPVTTELIQHPLLIEKIQSDKKNEFNIIADKNTQIVDSFKFSAIPVTIIFNRG